MTRIIRLTPFEINELLYKIDVILESGQEMLDDIKFSSEEIKNLKIKINSKDAELSDKEIKLLSDEADNCLSIVEDNYCAGFDEYKNDAIKLRKLVKKLS